MTTRQAAKKAADKKARERRNRNKRAAEVAKRAEQRRTMKEVRQTTQRNKAATKPPTWARALLRRMVSPLKQDSLTDQQIKEEYIKIAEKRSTLGRRQRLRIEHAHEQLIKRMLGLDKKDVGAAAPEAPQ